MEGQAGLSKPRLTRISANCSAGCHASRNIIRGSDSWLAALIARGPPRSIVRNSMPNAHSYAHHIISIARTTLRSSSRKHEKAMSRFMDPDMGILACWTMDSSIDSSIDVCLSEIEGRLVACSPSRLTRFSFVFVTSAKYQGRTPPPSSVIC